MATAVKRVGAARWSGSSWAGRAIGMLYSWQHSSWLLQWIEPLGTLLVAAVLVVAPFVSTGLIGLLLLAATGLWAVLLLTDRPGISVTPVHLCVLLFWAIAGIAVAFSPVPAAALTGWLKLSLYVAWFAFCTRVLRGPRTRNWATAAFLLVALVVSAYGVRQEFFGAEQLATWNDPESELAGDTRAYSYLGNPNLLAGYLISAVTLSASAVLAWRRWPQKLLALTMLVVNCACLLFTDSRGGWIGALAAMFAYGLLLYFWWSWRLSPFWRVWLLPLAGVMMVSAVGAAIASSESLQLRVASIFAGREDSSNNFRMTVWLSALDMIRDRPVIGIGPGNEAFNKIYPLYQRPNYDALSAYSIYLELAVEAGALGVAGFLSILVALGIRAARQLQRLRAARDRDGFWLIAAVAAIVGMLAHGLVDTVWYRPQIATLWWLLVALVASYYPAADPDASED